MGKVEQVSTQILGILLKDFQTRDLGADALQKSYVGVPLGELKQKCFESDNTTTTVDFDLALKELEDKKFVRTGPMVPYENDPHSSVVVIGLFSKREYAYLTSKGYKAAR